MAEFENPTFDPDEPRIDDAFDDLPEAPLEPPVHVKQELNTSGDRIQGMRDELRQDELEAQKKRLVDTFYKEVNLAYGLHPEDRIDYNQFEIDADGKTLYWTPGDKNIQGYHCDEGKVPVSGPIITGKKIRRRRHKCAAEITRVH